ncbi:MAG TPA: MFS transporter [Chthoniobacterales bacterium]|jgi:OPA family glycerol-3-phosphate transporter-like MFS transporter
MIGPSVAHPPGFRARRGLNWTFVGLLYTSFYTCRYNFAIANKSISDEFGFNKGQMGTIITTALLAYAFGQILNGLLTDRIGGKRAMLIGAAGTVIMNTIFGFASFWGLLPLFIVIRGIDGYLQSFGAPGMIKINAAWFARTERGRFAGIFGFMINAGRFLINSFGPALLAGFVFLGLWYIPPLHWRWLFWIPAMLATAIGVCMALIVKPTPREAGFVHPGIDEPQGDDAVRASVRTVFLTIASNPTVWIIALAYACTGSVRQSLDQWYVRLMQEVHHVDLGDVRFKYLGIAIPLVASIGSLVSGYVSDTIFGGRRAPVAAGLYFLESVIILAAAQFHSVNATMTFLILISLTCNATHSILGTAAAMDVGGARMAGFASGLIDSFQYFGGSLAGYFLGHLLDKSWGSYFYFMAPFGLIGGLLMVSILGKVTLAKADH